MDYSRLCKDIFDLDQKIRFAAVCNRTGEIKHGGQREGVRSFLSLEPVELDELELEKYIEFVVKEVRKASKH